MPPGRSTGRAALMCCGADLAAEVVVGLLVTGAEDRGVDAPDDPTTADCLREFDGAPGGTEILMTCTMSMANTIKLLAEHALRSRSTLIVVWPS